MEGVETRSGLYGFEFREVDRRRSEEGERKSYDVKQLWQRSHEILNLAVRGFKHTEIAEILNVTPDTVSRTVNGELGQRKLSELRRDRDDEAKKDVEKIRVLTAKAFQTYHEIFDNETVSLKDKKAVADTVLLELAGLRSPTKIQNLTGHFSLTPEELAEFKKRGVQAARDSGLIVEEVPDAEVEEIDEDKSAD